MVLLKVVLFFFTNGKHQLHKLSDTHPHSHARTHTHTHFKILLSHRNKHFIASIVQQYCKGKYCYPILELGLSELLMANLPKPPLNRPAQQLLYLVSTLLWVYYLSLYVIISSVIIYIKALHWYGVIFSL